jgi:septal ring factor EnvC (AmiA/AmiB activator)
MRGAAFGIVEGGAIVLGLRGSRPPPEMHYWPAVGAQLGEAQMEVAMATDDTIDALRDELQRVRIERAGLLSDVEQLKAELARLRTENESLRAELAAMPKRKRAARRRKTDTVTSSPPAEAEADRQNGLPAGSQRPWTRSRSRFEFSLKPLK